MLKIIQDNPLAVTIFGGCIVLLIGYVCDQIFGSNPAKKNQIYQSSVVGNVQQADIIFNTSQEHKMTMVLAPAIDRIPPILNGGVFQGDFASFQVSLGSEADLELIDAVLSFGSNVLHCESRDSKLVRGKQWNNLQFNSSELPYIPNKNLTLKIKVCDHSDECFELSHELQMKQFYPRDNPGKNFGRWEIRPLGIFKIKKAEKTKFH